MKLENTGVTSMDLDFEIPQPGTSIIEVLEEIQKRTNEKSGKTTLQLPMTIDVVVDGPESNHGCSMSHFVPIETAFGEKQLANIFTMTGLVDMFAKKFGNDVDITDDTFVNALKLKLPGKRLQITHDVRKDNAGKDRVSISRMEAVGGTRNVKAKPKSAGVKSEVDEGEVW